jgi:hypothetical protein
MIVETPTEGVLYDDPAQAYPVSAPRPLLEYGGTQGWQVVLKMTMGLENRPEHIRHGEDDAYKRYIRKSGPLLSLPKQGPAISAAWTALRFAGVIANLLSRRRCVYLTSEGCCSANTDLAKVVPHGVALGGLIPLGTGQF